VKKLNHLLAFLFFLVFLALTPQLLHPTSETKKHILGDSQILWNTTTASQITGQTITITATIDGYLLDMIGWTSPDATVHLNATQTDIEHHTIADKDGLFIFSSVLLPKETGLFCFISEDILQVSSIPYCLSPPSYLTSLYKNNSSLAYQNHLHILGDSAFKVSTTSGIVLAPSITLKETRLKQYTDLDTSGRTVPNSLVNIYLSQKEPSFLQKFFSFPNLSVKAKDNKTNLYHSTFSDPQGNFIFNLPTDTDLAYEFTTNSATVHGLSAESNPLRYQLYTSFQWFILKLNSFFLQIINYLLNLLLSPLTIIILELAILLVLLKKFFSQPPKSVSILPAIYPKSLAPVSHYS